jgi:hypothetical protein
MIHQLLHIHIFSQEQQWYTSVELSEIWGKKKRACETVEIFSSFYNV